MVTSSVVRPARSSRSAEAIRASVAASTAVVGSCRTSTGGVGGQDAGERDPLALAAGERPPALADPRREALGHRLGDLVDRRRGHGRRSASLERAAAADVVLQAALEQRRVVRCDQQLLPQRLRLELAQRHAVERDPAVVGVARQAGEQRVRVRGRRDDRRSARPPAR